MKKHFLINIVSLAVILTACTPQRTSTPTQVKIASTASNTPTIQQPPSTPTKISITGTKVPQSTETTVLQEECITLESKLPKDLVLSGVWVLNEGAPYLENLDDHLKYAVPLRGGGYLNVMAISPDGTHLAYLDDYVDATGQHFTKRMLRVIHSSGHEFNMDYWKQDWQDIIGWVDNENLAIYTGNKELIILNPLKGTWRKFQKPVWAVEDDNLAWKGFPYSPTLQLFQDRLDYKSMILMNVNTGALIWTAPVFYGDTNWSRNGTGLATMNEESVFVVNVDRPVEELNMKNLGYVSGRGPKLSPDGQKLAFDSAKNNSENRPESQLTVFDTIRHRLGRLCADGLDADNGSDPVWSPDNRFITASISTVDYPYTSFGILVDTQEMRAYKLGEDADLPLAWLAKP